VPLWPRYRDDDDDDDDDDDGGGGGGGSVGIQILMLEATEVVLP
jgi:hypothetical protein